MINVMDLFDQPAEESKKEFEALEAGNYTCEIEEAMLDEANKFGACISYTLRITSGAHKGRKIWVNRKLAANTMWKIRNDFDALGFAEVSSKNALAILEKLPAVTVQVNVSYAPNPKNADKPYQNVEFTGVVTATDDLPF